MGDNVKKNITIFILLITISLLTGCEKKEDKQEIKLDLDKIKYVQTVTKDNELLLTIKNPYEENINIEVTITYYDTNQDEIDFDYDFVDCVPSGQTAYLGFDLIDDAYSNYKIEIIPEINTEMVDKRDNIELKTTKKDKNIEAEILNKGDETIDIINIIVLYYQNDKIIGYDIGAAVNLENNRIKNIELYPPYQENKILEYDKYEIKINEAYTE